MWARCWSPGPPTPRSSSGRSSSIASAGSQQLARFTHTGHNIGLETEERWLADSPDETIEAGMAINIELYTTLETYGQIGDEETYCDLRRRPRAPDRAPAGDPGGRLTPDRSSPLRVGVLGLGLVSTPHLDGYEQAEGCELAVVCDLSEEKVAAVSAARGVRGTTEPDAVIADPEIDAVALLLPHTIHHRFAKAALEAGKHVCVEKPITVTQAEAEELIELAGARGLTLAVAENTRYVSAYVEAERILRDGDAGRDPRDPRVHPRPDPRRVGRRRATGPRRGSASPTDAARSWTAPPTCST